MAWGLSLVWWVQGVVCGGVCWCLLLCGGVSRPWSPAFRRCGHVFLWFFVHLALAYDLLSQMFLLRKRKEKKITSPFSNFNDRNILFQKIIIWFVKFHSPYTCFNGWNHSNRSLLHWILQFVHVVLHYLFMVFSVTYCLIWSYAML